MAEQQKIATVAEAEAVDLGEFGELLEKDFKVKKDDSDYAVMWMRGDDKPAVFTVHRIEASGALTPVDSAPLWSAVDARIAALTAPDCYSIDSDIAWRSFGLRYDMMGDNGSCGVAFLELGVEGGIVKVTDALVVRDEVKPARRHRPRRR